MALRVMALWFPDWPIQAADLHPPAVLSVDQRVWVCEGQARSAGIRRGMRIREAQALCPELHIAVRDDDRDARAFGPIVEGLDEVVASVEVLRPGLLVLDALAAARYHGGEDAAAELVLDSASRRGVDCLAGIADEITTAVIAARTGAVVPVGESESFLHRQPLAVLEAESALFCEPEVLHRFAELGLQTLGDLARLPARAVAQRFGQAGMACWDIAHADRGRGKKVAPPLPVNDYGVTYQPEEPLCRVDEAAFIARTLASQLHGSLVEAGLLCHRLAISAEIGGDTCSRVWRARDALSEKDMADRVRWQLDSWLSAGAKGGLTELRIEPIDVEEPEVSTPLWGGHEEDARARRAVHRVQSLFGLDAVVEPHAVPGRGVADRVTMSPAGESWEKPAVIPWSGAIPGPLPARLGGGPTHPAHRIRMVDRDGEEVIVTGEALLSSPPCALAWGTHRYRVQAWAGPWPVDDTLAGGGRCARLQVIGQSPESPHPHGWLMIWVSGQWRIEASYQ